MSGGLFNYGSAEIVEFTDTFDEADKIAKNVFKTHKGATDLHVWILRCEKTYCNAGITIERKKE
jgi:hypothetical protein